MPWGATRIPDPTTAGAFCRRFDERRIDTLQEVFNDARSLSAPVDTLLSNRAYMVIASLAWSLKAWMAVAVPE